MKIRTSHAPDGWFQAGPASATTAYLKGHLQAVLLPRAQGGMRPVCRHRDRYDAPKTADLRVLLAVAETGSVASAAQVLGLSRPAVYARLQRLYRERGIEGDRMMAVHAVWQLRRELEDLAAA